MTTDGLRRPITPSLERWRRQAPRASERTVIVRTSPTCDPDLIAKALQEAGANVQSSGPSVSTVRLKADSLERVAQIRGVVAIEEPKVLFPKSGY